MSLSSILTPAGAEEVLRSWPATPQTYRRAAGSIVDEHASLALLDSYIDGNCLVPEHVAVVKDGSLIDARNYVDNGRIMKGQLRKLLNEGHTLSLRNLQRLLPALAKLNRSLQQELGYPIHISGYLTPPTAQGLGCHWDQYTVLIAQISGRKRWPLYGPVVDRPVGEYSHLSFPMRGFTPKELEHIESDGPAQVVTLSPGDSLIVPRGWVHSPVNEGTEPSLHLTFALKERTRLWLAEQLVAKALDDPGFRAEVSPVVLTGKALALELGKVGTAVAEFLQSADLNVAAEEIRRAALSNEF